MIGITASPIVELQCDAYVVFHPANQISTYGVAEAIYAAGGARHFEAYRGILSRLQKPQIPGNLLPTCSDEGPYPVVLNMVDGFHRLMPDGEDAIRNLVAHFLREADHRGAMKVAVPPMGLHLDGGLTAEESAAVLLGGVRDYWRANPSRGPYQILIPLNENERLAPAYERGLAETFGMDNYQVPVELHGDIAESMAFEHLAALDDLKRQTGALSALREIARTDPASIGVWGAMKIAGVARGASRVHVGGSSGFVPRVTRTYHWNAIGVLETLLENGDDVISYAAGAHLAKIGKALRG